MYDVKVKTMDGRTHEFSLEDEITVLQFKENIREKMEIEIENQRLLYQGRALQDDAILASYNVAGNVMHLVTRPPPTRSPRIHTENSSSDENSDLSRDHIRNIISDVFSNSGEFNNTYGNISVNNEGNRMDITVNIPNNNTNRLSLARLRNNYIHRLLNQARRVLRYVEDENQSRPSQDCERLRQSHAHELAADDERLVDVNSSPLPVENLADLIDQVRQLWHDSEPQFIRWQNILRNSQQQDEDRAVSDNMQRVHDNSSRLMHLISHMMHIMSDYLVEFSRNDCTTGGGVGATTTTQRSGQVSNTTTTIGTSTNDIDTNHQPLTAGCGESATVGATSNADNSQTESSAAPLVSNTTHVAPSSNASLANTTTTSSRDRSRYLYVFSEMPAQLVQVRLDVDAPISDLRSFASRRSNTAPSSNGPNFANLPAPISTSIPTSTSISTSTSANSTTPTPLTTGQPSNQPTVRVNTTASHQDPPILTNIPTNDSRHIIIASSESRSRQTDPHGATANRNTRQDLLRGSQLRRRDIIPITTNAESLFNNPSGFLSNLQRVTNSHSAAGASSAINNGSQSSTGSTPSALHDTVDPYLRCNSRHFQSSNMRTSSVFSTYSGIRTTLTPRDRSRLRTGASTTTNTTPTTNTTGSTSTGANTTSQQTSASAAAANSVSQIVNGIMQSLFNINGDLSSTQASSGATPIINVHSNIGDIGGTYSAFTRPTTTPATTNSTASTTNNQPPIASTRTNQSIDMQFLTHLIQNFWQTSNPSTLRASLIDFLPDLTTSELFQSMIILPRLLTEFLSRLTVNDLIQLFNQNASCLNPLRLQLQVLLAQHQQNVCNGSRDVLIAHITDDFQIMSETLYVLIDELRSTTSTNLANVSAEALAALNRDIDIRESFSRLHNQHIRMIIDLIMRSPTDIGFGQLLFNLLNNLNDDSMVLLDIICGSNIQLRQYIIRHLFLQFGHSFSDSQLRDRFINYSIIDYFAAIYSPPDNLNEMQATITDQFIRYLSTTTGAPTTTTTTGTATNNNNNISNHTNQSANDVSKLQNLDDMVSALCGSNVVACVNELSDGLIDASNGVEAMDQDNNDSLPSAWNEIISQDTSNQDSRSEGYYQPPVSDAYLNGMPPKRRKLTMSQRQHNIQPPQILLGDCLNQAIQNTTTSNDNNDRSIASSSANSVNTNDVLVLPDQLVSSFQELVSNNIRQRMQQEQHILPSNDRFPNIEKHFTSTKRNNNTSNISNNVDNSQQ